MSSVGAGSKPTLSLNHAITLLFFPSHKNKVVLDRT
jgi:hypothetical protein